MRYKRKCRGLALFLAGSIVLSSTEAVYAKDAVYTQATISANTVSDNTFEQEHDAGSTVDDADGSVSDNDNFITEEPEESYTDGEYVIYIQEPDDNAEIVEEVKELDGTQEIAQDSEQAALFVADLTSEQAAELAQSEEGGILIEENIELTASGSKEKKKTKPSSKKTQGKTSAHKSSQKSDNKSNSKGHKKSNTETKKTDELLLEDEWNIQMIHADDVTVEAKDTVRIAVLDSGIDLISEVPVTDSTNMVEGEQDLPYYMNDMTGHGTAVGDIICQINPQAEIYSIRILDEQNKATLSRVVDAIYLCIDEKVDMINMSLGTNVRSGILEQAVKDAQDAGILLIAAAGNGGAEGGIEYPAAFDGVIAVGAVDTSAVRTEESAVGEQLDLVAPGEQIPAESMFGLCTVVSGTSMAVPHVTGVASVLWQRDKSKSARFIKGLIEETARALGEADEYGSGLVDLEYALASYDEYSEQYEEYEEADSESIETHRIVEPNEAEVLTFEDVNYVEGRWSDHEALVNYALSGNTRVTAILGTIDVRTGKVTYPASFTNKEIKAFKRGAVYPDNKKSGCISGDLNKNEWHGRHTQNYLADYIYATRIALHYGDTSKAKKVKGQRDDTKNRMAKLITVKGVNGHPWSELIKDYPSNNNSAEAKRLRQIFLYGMAMHIATDTYAHSAWVEDKDKPGYYYQLVHYGEQEPYKMNNFADDPTKCENRFKCAQDTAYMVYANCMNKDEGDIDDFFVVDKYAKGFYLGNCLKYAKETGSSILTTKEIEKRFVKMNLTVSQ